MSGGDHVTASDVLLRRVETVAAQVGDRFPLYGNPVSGVWTSTRRGSWTGGFWAGWWWLRAAVTGRPDDHVAAREWTHRLAPRAGDDTVTRGMTFWYGAALGQRLCGDVDARRIALEGAQALAASFDRRLGLIPVGTAFGVDGPPRAGVDALAGTVALLGWAADAGRYGLDALARAHVARHVELLVGDDGQVRPEVWLDPDGTPADDGDGSPGVWARGQAWGVLGLAVAARRWGGDFTTAAVDVARWWLDQAGTDVPGAVIGRAEAPPDTSAAAIAAAGLLTLSQVTAEAGWADAALAVASSAVGRLDGGGVLRDGCYDLAGGVAMRHELVWGSFFLAAVLAVLAGKVDEHPW
ncbi:hypothetical protein AB0C02_30755 [Micromonospora sp. NPDC048999]|uniref:hypothetical protein n=1 Tax=Micromonospora sp. NPDC048999 TaxID=3155391 RepID=UPI00340CCF78